MAPGSVAFLPAATACLAVVAPERPKAQETVQVRLMDPEMALLMEQAPAVE